MISSKAPLPALEATRLAVGQAGSSRAWRWIVAALVLLTLMLGASRILRTPNSSAPSPTSNASASNPSAGHLSASANPLSEQEGTWRWTQDPQSKLSPELLEASLAQVGAGSRWQALVDNQALPTGGKSVVWLHLQLPASPLAQTVYLEFERARVLKIEGFAKAADGRWKKESAGFTVPFNQRALPTQHPTFAIAQRAAQPTDYMLRVQHLAPIVLDPRLLASPGFADSNRQNGLADGLLLGALLFFCLLCLCAMAFTRSMGFVWPLLLALGTALVFGPTLGLTARWLWPDSGSLDRTLSWMAQPILAAITAVALLSVLWSANAGQRWARTLLWASLGCSILLIAAHMAMPTLFTLSLHRATGLVATLLMLASVWLSLRSARAQTLQLRWHQHWMALLLLGLVLVALISVPRLLRALGWIENNDWFELGGSLAYLMQSGLMYVAMVMANNRQLVRRELVSALSPVDPQTGLNTWRVCREAVERVIQRQSAAQHSASVLMIRVVNHSAIEDAAGFAAAQSAVVALGLRLRDMSHPLDSIAQHNPAMLVWAIDRALNGAELAALAQQIRLSNARPYESLAQSATHQSMQLAMVCALNPSISETADHLMERMAQALEIGGSSVQRSLQFLDAGQSFDFLS
jgi:GGDEF domain-containing protein